MAYHNTKSAIQPKLLGGPFSDDAVPADMSTSNEIDLDGKQTGPSQTDSLGIPELVPLAVEVLCDDAPSLINKAQNDVSSDEFPEVRDWDASHLFRHPVLLSVLTLGTCILLMLFLSQTFSFFHSLESLPVWGQILGMIALVLICLAVLLASARLVVGYTRLRQSASISLKTLAELQQREECRQKAHQGYDLAVLWIQTYLKDYPLEEHKRLMKLGFDEELHLKPLRNLQTRLCEHAKASSRSWLNDVNDHFLSHLDEVAAKRIKHFSTQVAIKTAITPTKFLDTGIVLVNSYMMLADLSRIYNLRTGAVSTGLLLLRTFINLAAAAKMEEVGEAVGEQMGNAIKDSAGSLVANIAGKFLGRLAEGTANGLLLYRLGWFAVRQLRPIMLVKKPIEGS